MCNSVEQYALPDIFDYNIGLGALTKFIMKSLKHRISNVELRKIQKENERKQRDLLLEEKEKMIEEKRVAL